MKKTFTRVVDNLKQATNEQIENIKPGVEKVRSVVDKWKKKRLMDVSDVGMNKSWLDDDFEPVDVDGLTDAVIRELSVHHKNIKRGDFRTKGFRASIKQAIQKEVNK